MRRAETGKAVHRDRGGAEVTVTHVKAPSRHFRIDLPTTLVTAKTPEVENAAEVRCG